VIPGCSIRVLPAPRDFLYHGKKNGEGCMEIAVASQTQPKKVNAEDTYANHDN
jgi:hypothetical protein